MSMIHPFMIVAGLVLIAWGIPAAHRLRPPFDMLAALAALAGLIMALYGTLLTAVPRFFTG